MSDCGCRIFTKPDCCSMLKICLYLSLLNHAPLQPLDNNINKETTAFWLSVVKSCSAAKLCLFSTIYHEYWLALLLTTAMLWLLINILSDFKASPQPYCRADRDSGIFCTAATVLFTTVKTLSIAALNSPNLKLPQPSPFISLLQCFLNSKHLDQCNATPSGLLGW